MVFIFRKRLSFIIFAVLFFVLIVGVQRLQTPGRYAFYANTWEGVGGGKDYTQKNLNYYLVSLPDGNRALAAGPLGRIAPDGQRAIVRDSFQKRSGAVLNLWDGTVQNFYFERSVYYPTVWSPNSNYIALGIPAPKCSSCTRAHPMDVGIVDTRTGVLNVLTSGEYIAWEWGGQLAWSPDGQFLAYIDTRFDESLQQYAETLKIISIDGGQMPRTLHTFRSQRESDALRPYLYWMPDARHIAVSGYTGYVMQIWYVDVQTGEITFHYAAGDYLDSCWSPTTGQLIAVTNTEFFPLTPRGTAPLDLSFIDPAIWRLRPGSTVPCAWSPDGTKIVLIYSDYPGTPRVKVIDFAARRVSDIQVGGSYSLLMPYWSSDSRMLALKTYQPSREPNDIFIYDMNTLQLVLFQQKLDFIAWLPEIP